MHSFIPIVNCLYNKQSMFSEVVLAKFEMEGIQGNPIGDKDNYSCSLLLAKGHTHKYKLDEHKN